MPAKSVLKKGSRKTPIRQTLKTAFLSLLFGMVTGCFLLAAGFYRYAVERVDSRLAEPIWELPGRIYAGPEVIWAGLKLDPESLARDLSSAGYARVGSATKPGDFEVSDSKVRILRKAAELPVATIKEGEVVVVFEGGRVASVTGKKAILPPPVLATVKGQDGEERSVVPLARIPRVVQDAVLAMEDSRFYQHPGVDPVGLGRAVFTNLTAGKMAQGGSTLTQQLAKNLFLTPERSLKRKVEEAFLALALEDRLGKESILEHYLNEIYLGQSGGSALCGVDAASKAWFGKPVERVELGEAAILAGVISAPNAYNPLRHPDEAKERRDIALSRMETLKMISAESAEKAKKAPLSLNPGVGVRKAPWAADAIVEIIEEALGEGAIQRGELNVYSTIHAPLQRLAEEVLEQGLAELEAEYPRLAGVQGALVAVSAKDGAILAVVGGRDYGESFFNRGLYAERQVGSTVKALTMLVAMERDASLGPGTLIEDAPITITSSGKDWNPKNYDGSYMGKIPLRRAIALSRNTPAVRLAQGIGFETLASKLQALGLSGATKWPATSLGGFTATPAQVAGAYALFASGGTFYPPYLVAAARGEALKWDHKAGKNVQYSQKVVFLSVDVLRSVLTEGTGKAAAKYGVVGAGGKSGTTDGYTDAWFAGFIGDIAVAVWVGFDTRKDLGLTGSQAALPIWAKFIAGSGKSGGGLSAPSGLVRVAVCKESGEAACGQCEDVREEWFQSGSEPSCGGLFGGKPVEGGEAVPPGEATKPGFFKKLGESLGFKKP
jgi:penicillin-binding protein 1B